MIAGTLELQMLANVARLSEDMAKANSIVGNAVRSIETILGTLGVGFSAQLLLEKLDSVIDRMDRLKNKSESTGASVENLSKLEFFATTARSNIEGVSTALSKLSTNMVGVGNEGAAATQALNFLKLSAKDENGNLKTADALYGEIAKKLEQYTDGAGKNAIARALMGKTGADQIPVMKQMIAVGDVEASVTDAQARAAVAYNLELAKLNRQKEVLWNTVVSALLPGMGSFVAVLIEASKRTDSLDSSIKGFAGDRSFENWTDAAAMGAARIIDVLKGIVLALDAATASFKAAQADVELPAKHAAIIASYLTPGGLSKAEGDAAYQELLDEQTKLTVAANEKLAALWTYEGDAMEKAMQHQIELRKAAQAFVAAEGAADSSQSKAPLNFSLGDAAAQAAAFKQYVTTLKALENELGKLNDQTEAQKLNFELYGRQVMLADGTVVHFTGSLEKMMKAKGAPEWAANLLVIAEEVDARKQLIAQLEAEYAATIAVIQADEQARQEVGDFLKAQITSSDQMKFEIGLIGKTADEQARLTAARKIDLEARAAIAKLAANDGLSPEAFQAAEDRIRDGAARAKAAMDDMITDKLAKERSWVTGTAQAFDEYVRQATNAAAQAHTLWTGLFTGMEDALYNFLRHGTNAFQSFVSTVKDLLARLAAQQITVQILGSVGLSGVSGVASAANATSGLSNILNFAGFTSSGYGATAGSLVAANVAGATGGDAIGTLIASNAASWGVDASAVGASSAGLATLSAAAPYVAAALFIANELGLFSGGGAPKPEDMFAMSNNQGKLWFGDNNISNYPTGGQSYAAIGDFINRMYTTYGAAQIDALDKSKLSLTEAPGTGWDKTWADFQAMVLDATKNLTPLAGQVAMTGNAAADASATLAIANAKRQMEIQLMQLQGDAAGALAAQRADELAAMDSSLSSLAQQIYAQQDLAAATKAAADTAQANASAMTNAQDALRTAYQSEVTLQRQRVQAVTDAESALRNAYQATASTLSATVTQWQNQAASLRAYAAGLSGGGTGVLSYGAASSQFSEIAARARLGDQAAMAQLQSAGDAFKTASLANSPTQLDYLRDLAKIQSAASDAAAVADRQASVAQQQLDALTEQVSKLIDINAGVLSVDQAITQLQTAKDAETAGQRALDAMTAQVSALITINTSVLSVQQAILNLGATIQALITGAGGGPVTGGVGNAATEKWISTASGQTWVSNAGAVALGETIHGINGQTISIPDAITFVDAKLGEGKALDVYAAAKAWGISLNSLDAIKSWGAGTAEDWARANGLPVFHAGTPFVQETGPAWLQRGERVTSASANDELVTELKAVRAELVEIKRAQKQALIITDKWDGDGMPAVRA